MYKLKLATHKVLNLAGDVHEQKKNRYKNEHEKVSWLVMASTVASHKHQLRSK